jgi:hypothetical protein
MHSSDEVVRAFNELGYDASFAKVARWLAVDGANEDDIAHELASLYRDHPSREALGESWLASTLPAVEHNKTLADDFTSLSLALLSRLNSRRDFSRAWLMALKRTGMLHLDQLRSLHGTSREYFLASLESFEGHISLPDPIYLNDVKSELADLMSLAAFSLIVHWETDFTGEYRATRQLAQAIGYLFEGLLVASPQLGNASMLVWLHTLVDVPRDRFLNPLLDMVAKSERARRFTDPLSLLELLKSNRFSTAQRQ